MKTLISYGTVTTLCASISLLSTNVTAADEAALYDLAPADAAFIRIINIDTDSAITASVSDKSVTSEGYCQASNYEYISAGTYELTIDEKNWKGDFKEAKTYTFVISKTALSVIEDDLFKNPKKGQFAAYNLTDKQTISVKTKDGKKSIFKEVTENQHVSREVNPIKIGLSIYEAEIMLLEADTAKFQRGKSKNLFVCGKENNYVTTWAMY